MSRRTKEADSGAMLEMWRPPAEAGVPRGCVSTTYTFSPTLFEEQCLGRFLAIDSEPDREDLPYVLERENRLGQVYAAVIVDHAHAGVSHSLRWDVLSTRIPGGIQHAKISLLLWQNHARVIVASANMSDPGYRMNQEVAVQVDLSPDNPEIGVWEDAADFIMNLLAFVTDSAARERAATFVRNAGSHVGKWKRPSARTAVQQRLVCTLPQVRAGASARSSLAEAMDGCRRFGGVAPRDVAIASPFFDQADSSDHAARALCKAMARGTTRTVTICVPKLSDEQSDTPRLAAPRSLFAVAAKYANTVNVALLPTEDSDHNARLWHAKMLRLSENGSYVALMVGSSNFTAAGLGIGARRNAEANLLTIARIGGGSRDAGNVRSVWPDTVTIADPASAEWCGGGLEEDTDASVSPPIPAGFLGAIYRAGEHREVVLRFNNALLPAAWSIHSHGHDARELLSQLVFSGAPIPDEYVLPWESSIPPEKLQVRWEGHDGFLSINVEDTRTLPPPVEIASMTSDDMLSLLAATDPGKAFRRWARDLAPEDGFDEELDSADPIDLDPLRRYNLQTTFLHRIRNRARVMASMRANLERPVWSQQGLEWRLRGIIGVEALATRLVREFETAEKVDDALLTLADFLIVLREVDYAETAGALNRTQFDAVFRPFLQDMASDAAGKVSRTADRVAPDVMGFWRRTVAACRN